MLIVDKIMLYKVVYKTRAICYIISIKGYDATNTIKLKVNGILTTVCDATQLNANTALQAIKTAYANNNTVQPLRDTGVYIVYGNTQYNIIHNTVCGNVVYIFTKGQSVHVTINYMDDWGDVTYLKTVKLTTNQTAQFNTILQ